MELTLPKVHRIIAQLIGAEAVTIQSHIHRVEDREGVCGAIVGADGVFYFDSKWWAEHINTPQKAKHCIMFELMKKVLCADRKGNDWITRIATGAVINSYLYHGFGYHELPRAMYSAIDLPECLMRPNARGYPSRLKRIYRGIWDREERFTDIDNVAMALRIIFRDPSLLPQDVDPNDVQVPGYKHGYKKGEGQLGEGDGQGKGEDDVQSHINDQLPSEVLEHMAEGISKQAGYSETMSDYVVRKMKSHKSVETRIIEDFALDQIKKAVRKHFEEPEQEESVVPLKLTRRECFNLARGYIPTMFTNEIEREKTEGGLAIYMDVSGSFEAFIPYTLGVLEAVHDMTDAIYQFSNKIHEMTIDEIKKGNIRIHSTGGTDFDCIMKHAIEKDYKKVMIVTDGYADVNDEELQKKVSENVEKVLVLILTRLPGRYPAVAAADADNPNAEIIGTIDYGDAQSQVDAFLNNTWLGQRYKKAYDLSKVFRG